MAEHTETLTSDEKHSHPAVFGLLTLPFGLVYGYLQVAVPYLLDKRGLSMTQIALVSAIAGFPHGVKFLWSPALDAGWKRKNWYLASIALTAASIALAALIPPDPDTRFGPTSLLIVFAGVLTIAQAAVSTSTAAVNALMATAVPKEKKGAVAGWSMAGNVGGTGVGGALALWLAEHVPPGTSAIILAAICVFCGVPAFFMYEPVPEKHSALKLLKVLLVDIWGTVKSREGWTGLLICVLPVGTGAATNLFSALSKYYVFAPDAVEGVARGPVGGALACFIVSSPLPDRAMCVELVSGMLGGVVGALGCLVGGYLADRMNRRLCYVLGGALTALSALTMGFLSAHPAGFTWGTLAYSFMNGISFAAFAAFVLEIVDQSAGVTTKYALYVGVSNQAISYVTWLDGVGSDWGRAHFADPARGARWGMLGTDALATAIGIFVLTVMMLMVRRSPPPAPPAEATT